MSLLNKLLGTQPRQAYEFLTPSAFEQSSLQLDLENIEKTHRELESALAEVRETASRVQKELTSDIERAKYRISVICDSLLDPLLMLDSTGKILSTNASTEDLFGYAHHYLMQINVKDLFRIDLSKTLRQAAVKYLEYAKSKPGSDYAQTYREFTKTTDVLNKPASATCENGRSSSPVHVEYILNILNPDVSEAEHVVFVMSLNDVTDRVINKDLAESLMDFQQRVLAAVPNPLFYMDSSLKVLGANDAFGSLVGVTKGMLVGRSLNDIFHETTSHRLYEIVSELVASNTSDVQTHELRLQTKTKVTDVLAMYCTTLRGSDGGFRGIMITFSNQNNLETLERFRDQVFQSVPIPLYYKDRSFTYVNVNQAFADWFGVQASDLIGKTREQVFQDMYAKLATSYPSVASLMDTLHENEDQLLAPEASSVSTVEHQMYNATLGELRKVRFYTAPIKDSKDQFTGLVGSIVDITNSHTVSEDRTILFESLPMPVSLYGADCVYLDCNTAFTNMLGMSKSSIINHLCTDDRLRTYEPTLVNALGKAVGKHIMAFECVLPNNKRMLVFKSPLSDSVGRFIGILNLYFDVDKYLNVKGDK